MSELEWRLANEAEDLLRTMPHVTQFKGGSPQTDEWIGRLMAFVDLWRPMESITLQHSMGQRYQYPDWTADTLRQLLYRAKHSLRLSIGSPASAVVGHGQVFDYFDTLRKVIEQGQVDIFFVDPYLSADFVSAYLPHIHPSASIRLLTSPKRLDTLVPALRLFVRQRGGSVELRTFDNLHDRYVFIDGQEGYQSGASFKDGAKNAPTALTQIMDTLPAVTKTYSDIWKQASQVSI
jgi:hypothetical protein